MKTWSPCSLLFFTLCILLVSQSATAKRVSLTSVCDEAMEDKVACMALVSDPRIIGAAGDVLQLAQIVLEIGLTKATTEVAVLKGIALTNRAPAIVQCANFFYKGVVGSFKSALDELTSNPQKASHCAMVAGDGPRSCERVLAAERIVNPIICGINREISLLSKIAFIITSKL